MSKKCECGKELLPEWEYCPECGKNLLSEPELSRAEELYRIAEGYNHSSRCADTPKALKYYIEAAELNHSKAQYKLIYLYGHGDREMKVEINYEQSLIWCSRFVEQENADKITWSIGGLFISSSLGTEEEVNKIKWLKSEVAQGNVLAQVCLGDALYFGKVIEQDLVESKQLFELATKQDDGYAKRFLSLMFKE